MSNSPKRYAAILGMLVFGFAGFASAQTGPQPDPDAETLKLQVQMFQGLYQADEAKLGLAKKEFDDLNKKIADLEKKLADAKKPQIPKTSDFPALAPIDSKTK